MTDEILIYWTDKDNVKKDITRVVSELRWSESEGNHTMEISFNVPDTNERYVEHYLIEAGDKIQLVYNGKTLYSFEVTEVEREFPRRNVTGKDFCFYIEKNEGIAIQFSGISCKKAVETLCAELGIAVGEIAEMSAVINKVYIDGAENIIEDILEKQRLRDGCTYDYEMDNNRLRVYKLSNDAERYVYKPAVNVAEIDVTEEHSPVTYKHSIENMKNTVRAIIKSNTEGNMPAVEYTVSDSDSVKRYGKLSTKIEVGADEQQEIEELAKNELKDKNKIEREISCNMLGAINARRNRVMHITDEYTGIDALMRITDSEHTYENGIYKMNLSFKYIKEYEAVNIKESKIQRENVELNGKSVTYYDSENTSADFKKLLSVAKKYIGVPYVWGGYSPKGFDCSGFVCYVLKESGVWDIGRTTAQGLYNSTKRVKSPQAGDLVFWIKTNPNSSNLITHVGICIGNGKNIQASSSEGVSVQSNGGAYAYGRY